MVPDDHEISRLQHPVHGACGVRQNSNARSQIVEQPYGAGQLLIIVSFIIMKPSGHTDDRNPADPATDQFSRMRRIRRYQKIRDLAVGDPDGVLHRVRQSTQTGPEHQGDPRRFAAFFAHILRRFFKKAVFKPVHRPSPLSLPLYKDVFFRSMCRFSSILYIMIPDSL